MARKSMNLLDTYAWINRWKNTLKDSIIANIYYTREPEEKLLLKLKTPGNQYLVLAEPGKRIHLTWRTPTPGDYKPYPIVALARKHLRGDRIEDIRLAYPDRIVEIRGKRGYKIIIELLPRGIIALLDPENTVLAPSRTLKTRDRLIRPKTPYKPPPIANSILAGLLSLEASKPSPSKLLECASTGKDLVRGLIRGCGIPGEAAEETIYRAGLEKNTKPNELKSSDYEILLKELEEIIEEANKGKGYLVLTNEAREADPFKPLRFIENNIEAREYQVFDEALDELFTAKPEAKTAIEAQEDEDPELTKLRESLRRAEERVSEFRERASEKRKLAEVIAANYAGFNEFFNNLLKWPPKFELGRVKAVKAGDHYIVETPFGSFTYKPGERVDEVIVRLYKEAGELESKAERALAVREEILARAEELRLKARARSLMKRARKRRRFWFERFHWTITRGGLLAVGGKDAGQNEALVKRYLEEGDLFLHASIHGAPAVVLKTKDRMPSVEDLWDAAVLTAAYSRAWKAGAGSIEVYYAESSQVSFSPPSGEYLAKGGIMVYGRKKYLPKPVPVRIAIGLAIEREENVPVVIAGSEESVSMRSIVYVILAPGDQGKEQAGEEIRRRWAEEIQGEDSYIAYAVPPEELYSRIPGRSRILSVKRGRSEGVKLSDLA